jgi:hypothetical protein
VSLKEPTIRRRFYVEVVLGLATILLFALTLINKEWIEIVFHVDPDEGNGAVEYLIVFVLLAATAVSWWLARTEWRRARSSAPAIR